MDILFIHPNMPGQYKHLAKALAANPENRVVFLTNPKPGVEIPGVVKIEYKEKRDVTSATHRYLIAVERGVHKSQEVWRVCKKIKEEGFTPDVICGHLGWGDGYYLKDIYPGVPILSFMEFFYSAYGGDVDYLPDHEITEDDKARIRSKNLIHLMNLHNADWMVTPTHFQHQRHPVEYQHKIAVLHDGIDTERIQPDHERPITLSDKGITLTPQDEVITYIARNFEPYRGFPQFMRAAEIIQKERPNAHICMVGQDGVSYGRAPEGGRTWREIMMEEVKLDMSRFHVMGYLPYDKMLRVLQISSAHIYLTVPFVLSWSMMEAMAAECLMICSDTAPVREVITHEENGLLVDFLSPESIAAGVSRALDERNALMDVRRAARQTILDRYALEKVLPLHMELVQDVAKGIFPPPAHQKILDFDAATRCGPLQFDDVA